MSFVEEATLKLTDQASATADKINAAMDRLDKTAQRLKSSLNGFNIDMSGIATGVNRGLGDLQRLEATAQSVRTAINGMKLTLPRISTAAAHQSIATLLTSSRLLDGQQKLRINNSDVDYAIQRVRALVTDLQRLDQTYTIRIDTSQITRAAAEVRTLHGLLSQPLTTSPIQVNTTQIQQAINQLNTLRTAGGQPINLTGNLDTRGFERSLAGAFSRSFSNAMQDIKQNLGLTVDQLSQRAGVATVDISKGETDLAIKLGLGSRPMIEQLKKMAAKGNSDFSDVSVGAIMRTFGDVIPNMKTAEDAFAAAEDIPRQLAIFNTKYGPNTKQAQAAAVEFNKSLILLRAIGTDERATSIRDRLLQQSQLSGVDVTEAQVKRWMQGIPTAMLQSMNAEMVTTLISGGEEQQQRFIQGARMLFEGFTNNNIAKKQMEAQQAAVIPGTGGKSLRDQNGLVVDSKLLGEDQFAWVEKNLRPVVERDLKAAGKTLQQGFENTANAVEVQNVLGRYLTASRSRLAAAYITEADFIKNERRKVQRVDLKLAAQNDSIAKSALRVGAAFDTMAGTALQTFQPQIADASKIAANAMGKLTKGDELSGAEMAAIAGVSIAALGANALLTSDDPVAKAVGAAALVIGVAGYMMQDAIGGLVDATAQWFGTETPEQMLSRDRKNQMSELEKRIADPATDAGDRIRDQETLKMLQATEKASKDQERQRALDEALKNSILKEQQDRIAQNAANSSADFATDYFGKFTDRNPAQVADVLSKMLGTLQDGMIGPDDLRAMNVRTIQELQKKLGATADGKIGDETASRISTSEWLRKIVEQVDTVKSQGAVAGLTTDKVGPPVKVGTLQVDQVDVAGKTAIETRLQQEAAKTTGMDTGIMDTVMRGTAFIQSSIGTGVSTIGTAAVSATAQIQSAVTGTGAEIAGALSSGAQVVASAIVAALSTPVNINMPRLPGASPVDVGTNKLNRGQM